MKPKMGSLFDGSGGFPLSAAMCGIVPEWASEVEPFPIAVTRSRFPNMKHLGSVTDVKGDEVEPVDVITFGSPCQDLSVAGKRAGLKHTENGDEETTRSGLFMEAVRIIKEMRKATNGVYPRFAVWENVPGAFSSNKGEDFRIVLEEFIKIVEPTAVMPTVPKNGWPYADSYCGDGWSLSYRVFDAQYWGVPQRRRRIYLVADFRSQCAGEVLFKREGLRGYLAQSGAKREAVAGDAESGIGAADCGRISDVIPINTMIATRHKQLGRGTGFGLGEMGDAQFTISAGHEHAVCYKEAVPYTLKIRSGCDVDSAGKAAGKGALIQENMSATLAVSQDQYLFQPILDDQGGSQINVRYDGKSPTLRAEMHGNVPCVMESAGFNYLQGSKARTIGFEMEKAGTLRAGQFGDAVIYSIENHPADSRVNIDDSGKVQTLTSRMGTGGGNVPMVMEPVAYNGENITSPLNKTNPKPGDPCHTLGTDSRNYVVEPVCINERQYALTCTEGKANTLTGTDYKGVQLVAIPDEVVYCLQGNGIDRADTAGCNGKGWNDEACYTLNTIDRPAVAYAVGNGQLNQISMSQVGNTLDCMHDKQAVLVEAVAGVDCRNLTEHEELYPTLQAKPNGGQSLNYSGAVRVRYIVRRLTPTECARLQGFPDNWARPDVKTELTDEEYRFWMDVRNTHAEINGKATKEYTRDQMLTWYNKLHTDSAEYKLWGNGIALPCALYVMQGIAEVLHES